MLTFTIAPVSCGVICTPTFQRRNLLVFPSQTTWAGFDPRVIESTAGIESAASLEKAFDA